MVNTCKINFLSYCVHGRRSVVKSKGSKIRDSGSESVGLFQISPYVNDFKILIHTCNMCLMFDLSECFSYSLRLYDYERDAAVRSSWSLIVIAMSRQCSGLDK